MDTRDFAKARRERTRHLIELGGLVQKAGLVELAGDDRTVILGALVEAVERLNSNQQEVASSAPSRADILARWKRKGRAKFDTDEAAEKAEKRKIADGERDETRGTALRR